MGEEAYALFGIEMFGLLREQSVLNDFDLNFRNFIAAGSTKTLTEADHMSTVKLDTATGSVVTLPAATGTGSRRQPRAPPRAAAPRGPGRGQG